MESIISIGVSVLILALLLISLVAFVSKNYIKVPPNKVAVFYGRKNKMTNTEGNIQTKGYRVVTGGAKFRIPILEMVTYLDLNVFSIDIDVKDAPNKDGVPVTLRGVANVKIKSDEHSLMNAAERFLNMPPSEIKNIAFKNLEGHLRSIAGTMTIEDLVGDRTKLNSVVLNDAAKDLDKMGLGIDLLTIQEIADKMGYIEQLGKKRTAEVVRDAKVGTAEAEREATIQTTTANKEGQLKANENIVLVADSERERDVKKAQFSAKVSSEQATAAQAGPLADAEARRAVVIAQQEVLKGETEKAAEVAEAEANKREKELLGEVIKPAEAHKRAVIIDAEAKKQARIIEAQGEQEAIQMIAEAEKTKLTREGEGIAAAIQAKLVAEAEGKKAILLAEAAGILKKAEAYEKLDKTGKLLQVLEVVERVLPGAIKEFAGVMEATTKPLGNIKEVRVMDFGGNSSEGGALTKFGKIGPELVTKVLSGLKASGINVDDLLSVIGVDASDLFGEDVSKKTGKADSDKKEAKK